jgi:hypothetical protein
VYTVEQRAGRRVFCRAKGRRREDRGRGVRTGGREIGGGRDYRGIGWRLGSTEMHGVRCPLRSLRAARRPPPTPRQHQTQGDPAPRT